MPFLRKYGVLTVTGTTAIRIPLIKRAVVDFAVGADYTPAAGDWKIAIDGTAPANVANLPTAVASGNGAFWEFVLTAAELTGKQMVILGADSATKAIEDQCFIVETFGHASAMYQPDYAAANLPVNVIQVGGTVQTAGDIMADTNDIQTRLPAALVGGRMDSSTGAMAAAVLTAAAIAADAITDAKVAADVTIASVTGSVGSVAGAVGSVTGAVGSVTGAVGSVTGNVGGNVVGSVASVVGNVGGNVVGTVASVVGAVASVTAGVTVSAASITAIWNEVVDGTFTARQLMRGFASALLSICSGMATGTGVFRDISNTKNRISVTQDANGNRSAFGTLDLS